MIVKHLAIYIAISILITASDLDFGSDLSWYRTPKKDQSDVQEITWKSPHLIRPYLLDKENRVHDIFQVPPYYYPNVAFWFLIYTQFNSTSVVLHDKNDLSLIYKVLDFSALHNKNLHKNTIYLLQEKISNEKKISLKEELSELEKNPFSLTPSSKKILHTLKQSNIALPIDAKERSSFFKKLRKNVRTQTGQKNFIRDGVIRSLPYQNYIAKYFTDRKLPKELLAIPFLESSFNPQAHSKVSALGIWQFMPLTASYFMPKRTLKTDYRSNIGVSSIAASFLLEENFKIMKSWDLSITAYNSGTKHLLKTRRELSSTVDSIDLEAVIKNSDSQYFGFASKNFYSEFLALVHTLAYRDELFEGIHAHDRPDVDHDLNFYITKCSLKLTQVLDEQSIRDVQFHNHHLKDLNKKLPRGYILTVKGSLPLFKFYKIEYKNLLMMKPKAWGDLIKRQSCSTR